MLKKRIVSSFILLFVFLGTVFIDWLFGLLVVVFTIIGLYEFFTMLEKKGISIYKYFGITMGAIIPLSILLKFELTRSWELLFVGLALLSLILMQFTRRDNEGVTVAISTTIFGILYVSWFLSFFIRLRYMAGGVGLIFMLILITKIGDIGAYFIGVRFGKTPLIPRISPNKSMEGALGGLVFSVLGAMASKPFFNLPYSHLALLGIFLGILGQLGDLSESLIKRDCQVKDAGKALPGMGGVLDFIDSLLFTAPAFYFFMSIILR